MGRKKGSNTSRHQMSLHTSSRAALFNNLPRRPNLASSTKNFEFIKIRLPEYQSDDLNPAMPLLTGRSVQENPQIPNYGHTSQLYLPNNDLKSSKMHPKVPKLSKLADITNRNHQSVPSLMLNFPKKRTQKIKIFRDPFALNPDKKQSWNECRTNRSKLSSQQTDSLKKHLLTHFIHKKTSKIPSTKNQPWGEENASVVHVNRSRKYINNSRSKELRELPNVRCQLFQKSISRQKVESVRKKATKKSSTSKWSFKQSFDQRNKNSDSGIKRDHQKSVRKQQRKSSKKAAVKRVIKNHRKKKSKENIRV